MTDMVNHPPHYTAGGIECIDALRAALGDEAFVCFCRATAIKYLWRAGLKKDPTESEIATHITDIRKAIWYLEDEVKLLEGAYNAKTNFDLFSEKEIPACIVPETEGKNTWGGVREHCAYCGSHDHATNECPGQFRL